MQDREARAAGARAATAGRAGSGGAVLIDIDAELSCWQQLECSAASELVFLFHEWEPAIRVAIHAYLAYPDRDFDSIEPHMLSAYQRIRGGSRIPWARAAPAARRVWEKLQSDEAAGWSAQARHDARAGAHAPAAELTLVV